MNNMDIVRNVSTVLADHVVKASTSKKRAWKWTYQTIVFPEVKCPYCKKCVTSSAIWFIEKENRLVGQAIPVEGSRFKLESPDHPHACNDGRGQICFGTSASAVHALFGSLNKKQRYMTKEGGYGGVPEWLAGKYFNHRCEKIDKWLGKGFKEEENDYYCAACGDAMPEDDVHFFRDDDYCVRCFNVRAFICYDCGGTCPLDKRKFDADDNALCNACLEAREETDE